MPQKLVAEVPHFGTAELAGVRISAAVARELDADLGDLLYVTDTRWWTGGLHSAHVIVAEITSECDHALVAMDEKAYRLVVGRRTEHRVRLERLYESLREDRVGVAPRASR